MLAITIFGVAAIIARYPLEFKNYVNLRLEGLCLQTLDHLKLGFAAPGNIMVDVPINGIYAISGFLALGGLFTLFGIRIFVGIYACLILIMGTLLHLPYSKGEIRLYPAAQIRKLVFVIAFSAAMIMSLDRVISKKEAKEIDKAEKKAQKKAEEATKKKEE